MEKTIKRLIGGKDMIQGEADDIGKEICNLNIAIENKIYEIRKCKRELRQLKKTFEILENLSIKIALLAVTLEPLEQRIKEIEAIIEAEYRNKEILEELKNENKMLKKIKEN